jgi:peptidoglycan/LPS O-acetylase OafA/YrhL
VLKHSDEAKALSHHSPSYRPEIDGLRAVAVLAVLITHLDPHWLPGGFLGVDLFFVISGYVVTASIARRQETNALQMLAGFYARRFRRLIPALLLMVAITVIVFCAFVPREDDVHSQSIRTGLASLAGLSNLYLLSQGNNYFDFGTQFNPFLHTWSLGVEEQFYFVWPLLVLLSGVGFKGSSKRSLFCLLWLTLFLAILSLFLYAYLSTHSGASAAFYLMPARFWELSAGAMVFLGQQCLSPKAPHRSPVRFPSLIQWGLIGVLLAGFVFASEPATLFKSSQPLSPPRLACWRV